MSETAIMPPLASPVESAAGATNAPTAEDLRARLAGGALAASTVIDVGALAWLGNHHGLGCLAIAGLAHVGGAIIVVIAGGLQRSQRLLSAALTFSLPVVGAPIAAFILGTIGRSEIADVGAGALDAAPAYRTSPEELLRMAGGLSCCEALLASEVEERRAILSTLSRHPDRNAVALLRWALTSRNADLAVEAALALEDVGATFDAHLAACRAALAQTPSFTAALAVADSITHGIEVGIADTSLVSALAHEARQSYARAVELDPARFDVAAVGRARMELAVLRPDTALEVIDHALPTAHAAARAELVALRQEAVLASHSLPWEGPSALATYRRPLPRAGTARRHTLVPLLGTEVPRGRV